MCVYDLRFLRGRVLVDLVQLFANNRALLEAKGAFILRRLCLLLDGRIIYCALARILLHADNREFASLLVELLSLILLTAVELTDLREQLRGCCAAGSHGAATSAAAGRGRIASTAAGSSDGVSASGGEGDKSAAGLTAIAPSAAGSADGVSEDEAAVVDPEDGVGVFLLLYRTWCHNPIATLALCLLTEAYELGARLVARFGETTISVGVLMQCDKLVQLLETPIFVNTRLHLTQPERPDHGHLLRSLYGLLMLMPQGTAYATLRDRLTSVTSLHIALGSAAYGGAGGRWQAAPAAAPASLQAYGGAVGLDALAGPLHGTAAAPSAAAASPFDLDTVFSVFADSQAVYKAALREDLRSRSVLHRYNTLQAQLGATAAASAAAVAVATAAASAASVMSALPGPVGAGDAAVGVAGGEGGGAAAAAGAGGQARRSALGAVPTSAVKAAGGAAQAPSLLGLGETPETEAASEAAEAAAPAAPDDAGAEIEEEAAAGEAAPGAGAVASPGASGHLLRHQRSLRDELRGLGVATPAARAGASGSGAGDLTPSPAPDTPLPGAAAPALAAVGAPGANGAEVRSRAGTESEGSSSDDEEEGGNQ
jgi:hypothetical protein